MTDAEAQATGNDLAIGTIQVGDLVLDDRLRIDGALWIEDKTGKPLVEFLEHCTGGSISDMLTLLGALYYQKHPDSQPDDLRKAVGGMEITEIGDLVSKVKMDFEPKNSQTAKLVEEPPAGP
jgi:hypothetical protein